VFAVRVAVGVTVGGAVKQGGRAPFFGWRGESAEPPGVVLKEGHDRGDLVVNVLGL